jgi:hypothetical protein
MLWNGNKCGKNYGNGELKDTIPSTDYGRSKTSGEVKYFKNFGSRIKK